MKKNIFVFLLLFSIYAFPQDPPLIVGELIIYFIDKPVNWDLTVKIDAIGTVWDKDHYLTTSYEGGEKDYDESGNDYHSSDFCWSRDGFTPYLGLGNYKISIWSANEVELARVYLDLRTSDLPDAASGGSIDVSLDYSITDRKFFYRNGNEDITNENLKIWELKTFVDHITTDLEPFPPQNISVISSYGRPRVLWDHSSAPDDYVTKYNIYRTYSPGGVPDPDSFSKIGSVYRSITNYTDYDYSTGRGWTFYYAVKAENGTVESVLSDMVDIEIDAFSKQGDSESPGRDSKNDLTYYLHQNYPNPFNPATIINYSIKRDGFVKLKVYDVLGKEVALLVNENLSAGRYQVEFNGSNLQSGVYFYEISTGNFRDVKRLLLLK